MLIDEECGNLKAVVHGGELTRNATQNKKPHVLQACRYALCDKCNKHREYCESVR